MGATTSSEQWRGCGPSRVPDVWPSPRLGECPSAGATGCRRAAGVPAADHRASASDRWRDSTGARQTGYVAASWASRTRWICTGARAGTPPSALPVHRALGGEGSALRADRHWTETRGSAGCGQGRASRGLGRMAQRTRHARKSAGVRSGALQGRRRRGVLRAAQTVGRQRPHRHLAAIVTTSASRSRVNRSSDAPRAAAPAGPRTRDASPAGPLESARSHNWPPWEPLP